MGDADYPAAPLSVEGEQRAYRPYGHRTGTKSDQAQRPQDLFRGAGLIGEKTMDESSCYRTDTARQKQKREPSREALIATVASDDQIGKQGPFYRERKISEGNVGLTDQTCIALTMESQRPYELRVLAIASSSDRIRRRLSSWSPRLLITKLASE